MFKHQGFLKIAYILHFLILILHKAEGTFLPLHIK